jgi:hypothetical protein
MFIEINYVEPGYWKIDNTTTSTLKCPYSEHSCHGGFLSGNNLCDKKFIGFLCAESISNYYINWIFRDSLPCNNYYTKLLPFLLAFPVGFILPFFIFFKSGRNYCNNKNEEEKKYDINNNYVINKNINKINNKSSLNNENNTAFSNININNNYNNFDNNYNNNNNATHTNNNYDYNDNYNTSNNDNITTTTTTTTSSTASVNTFSNVWEKIKEKTFLNNQSFVNNNNNDDNINLQNGISTTEVNEIIVNNVDMTEDKTKKKLSNEKFLQFLIKFKIVLSSMQVIFYLFINLFYDFIYLYIYLFVYLFFYLFIFIFICS